MKINFNFASNSKMTLKADGHIETVGLWERAHKLFEGRTGRIMDTPMLNPSLSKAAAHPNGKTTLDLVNEASPAEVSGTLTKDRKTLVRTSAFAQKRDHPSGVHYWLPLDDNNRFICEPGQRHRKWYLSKSPTALTKAKIAGNAGVLESAVTAEWLLARPQYGGTPQTAIHADLYSLIKPLFAASGAQARSDHWFLECGYDYADLSWAGMSGEDELHPMLITQWGTGAKPIIKLSSNSLTVTYAVIDGVATTREGFSTWYGYSIICSHMSFGREVDAQRVQTITYYENDILCSWRDAPHPTQGINADGKWEPQRGNHIQGIFSADTEELAIINNQIDHTGWGEGYDFNGDATKPQPPFMFSHCLYLSASTYDTTVRGNLLSRAAAQGIGKVGGIHLEANLLVDNNFQIQTQSTEQHQFTNVMDNVAFSAGWKKVAYSGGGYNWGMTAHGPLSGMSGNILAHQANPDDPVEMAAKPLKKNWDYGVSLSDGRTIEDTQSWKWSLTVPARNVEGIASWVLDETTIQRFTGMKMGKTFATIVEMVEHVKGLPSKGAFVDEAVRWTKSRFGTPIPQRSTPANLVFYPDLNFDGFRWDNRRNWSTKDLPGCHISDSVDLSGSFVRFGLTNTSIAALKSSGGTLDITSGKLEVGALTDAANLVVRKSGQAWIGAADHPLAIEASSGRLALSGAVADLDLFAGGQAQTLLGPECTVLTGKSLVISGQQARVGWDGTGTAALTLGGKLEFRRGVCVQINTGNKPQLIRYAYKHIGKQVIGSISGATGRVGAVERRIGSGFIFNVWLYDVVGMPVVGDVLAISLALKKDGSEIPNFITVASIIDQSVAPLQRFRSGAIGNGLTEPTVAATITLTPSAQIVVSEGLPSQDLTGPGVTVVNSGATLPAGVSITGGKLVYTA